MGTEAGVSLASWCRRVVNGLKVSKGKRFGGWYEEALVMGSGVGFGLDPWGEGVG